MSTKLLFVLLNAIVQGVTEFFPVSSSGHLMLLQHFFKNILLNNMTLDIILHLGTLIAITCFYHKVILKLIHTAVKTVHTLFKKHKLNNSYYERLLLLLAISTAPLIFTLILKKYYRNVLNSGNMTILGIFFIFTAIIIFISSHSKKGNKDALLMSYKDALLIGFVQALITPLPGVSRSGLTIAVSLILGLSIKFCVMYSFLLEIPVVMGALIVEAKNIILNINKIELPIALIGIVTSAVLGAACIKILEKVIENKFCIFAYYLAFVGLVTLCL